MGRLQRTEETSPRPSPWKGEGVRWGVAGFIATVALLGTAAGAVQAQNLLTNPTFDGSPAPTGWDQIWSRDAGGATESVDADHPSTSTGPSLKVASTSDKDWSVGQSKPVAVKRGDILTLSGWLKANGDGNTQLSLHTCDSAGNTLDWMAGLIQLSGTSEWQFFTRKFVVPAGCATVQYRLTGDGHETSWLSTPSLQADGNVNSMVLRWNGKVFTLHAAPLSVRFNPSHATLAIMDKRNGHAWWQMPVSSGVIVRDVKAVSPTELRCALWDVANDLHLAAEFKLTASELTVSLHGDGAVHTPVAFPLPFHTDAGDGLVVPLNEGILYPVDDQSIQPYRLPTYMGNSTSMPWTGVVSKTGAGLMTVIETPNDAAFDIERPSPPAPSPVGTGEVMMTRAIAELTCAPVWEATKGRFGYARRLSYVVFDKGGYVAQAKWYRRYAQKTGQFKTLAQKRKANPNVDRLIGAANIWNWDAGKLDLCREMKSAGMDHILWSNGGNAGEIEAINKLGFLTSRYDIYQDVWPSTAPDYLHKEGWPDDLVLLPGGDWMKGWADIATNPDGTKTTYQGGVINSARGLARAKREIPEDLRNIPYTCRFLDTTTASPWREDYSPIHPLTRSQDRANKMALLGFCSGDMKLVTGSETGIDTAAPYVDYFEGMMSLSLYRLEDAGRNMLPPEEATPDIVKFMVGPKYRIPLWELVYHDCVVSYWYWGDYNNKVPSVWRKRDLFNILYATPPMYMFDKSTWASDKNKFVHSYHDICPIVRKLGYDEMLSHAFLNADHTLQETRWKSGTRVVINLGNTPRKTGGVDVPAMGFRVVAK